MADKTRYTNVSLAKIVHEGLQEISREISPLAHLSMSKTIAVLVAKYKKKNEQNHQQQ
tara:strand:+ start:202 stop:375 length:174 start_codon:yes stop_codon:yes gene_type:complete